VYVDRSKSSPFEEFNNSTEVAKFRLWEKADEGLETLNVRLFADGSVVELYINDRFALTTRIYPSEDSCEIGYYTDGGIAKYSDIEVWDGLANAWPSRPADTSIPFVWDGEPYTNYWPGY
jgi:beta-fructofuranosidase